jgi:hypothetical protein
VRRCGERRKGVARHLAEMAGPPDRIIERVVTAEEGDRVLEIAIADLAPLDDPLPEPAVFVRSAAVGEDKRQGDLAVAKIGADGLAEVVRIAAVIEHVVDQLEDEAEIGAV